MTIKELNRFRKEFMGGHYKPTNNKGYLKIKDQPGVYVLQLKNEKNDVFGIAIMSIITSLTRTTLTIEDIIIDKKYRRKGYCKLLMAQIIKVAKAHKVNCIDVNVKRNNRVAQNIYYQFGFKSRRQVSMRKWLKQP